MKGHAQRSPKIMSLQFALHQAKYGANFRSAISNINHIDKCDAIMIIVITTPNMDGSIKNKETVTATPWDTVQISNINFVICR